MIVICFASIFLIGLAAGMSYQAHRLQEAGIIKVVNGKMKAIIDDELR